MNKITHLTVEEGGAQNRRRIHLREISGDGLNFGLPQMINNQIRSVVAWSRIFVDQELVCAMNTDPDNTRTAWVTIDDSLHDAGDQLTCVYASDGGQLNSKVIVDSRNGKAAKVTIPKGGFVVFKCF